MENRLFGHAETSRHSVTMAEAPESSTLTAQSDTRTETAPPTSSDPSFESHLHPNSPPLLPSSERRKVELGPVNEDKSHPHLRRPFLLTPSESSPHPHLHPPPPSSPSSAPSLREPPPSPPSSAPSLRELSVLPVTRWYVLGLQLGVDQHDLDVIEKNYPRDNDMCKLKMFGTWLRTDPSATYEKLVRGLAAIGMRNMAESLCNTQGIPLSVLSDVAKQPPAPPPAPPPATPQCIADYASFLKYKYQRMNTLPDSDWPPAIGRQYTRLAMIEIERRERLPDAEFADTMEHDYLHGKIDNIRKRKQGIELQEAFLPLTTGEEQLKILMDGAPGVGKTTLSRKACKDWASGKLLQNYHLVMLLPLRERKVNNAQTVEDLFFADDQQLRQQVVQHICQTSGEHLLIIFDGYDELSFEQRTEDSLFQDIIQGNQLHKCSVLVTSRPYASDYLQQLNCINRHVEVLGFTEEQIQTCIRQKVTDQAKASELLRMLKERLDITSLCYTPLNCAIVLYVYEQELYKLPSTLTGLYEVFILNTLRRHARHLSPRDQRLLQSARSIENIPPSVKMQLDSLSKLAFDALVGDNMVLNYFDMAYVFPEADFETNLLGLMTAVKGFTTSGTEMHYQFLHLSIQEFLAARWAATPNPAEIFQKFLGIKRFQMMLLFLAGLSGLMFASFDKIFSSSIQFPPSVLFKYGDPMVIRHFLFLVHLIFESQQFSLYRTISNAVTDRNLNLSHNNLPFSHFDCLLLASFLRGSDCSWEVLDLSHWGLTEEVGREVERMLIVSTTLKVLKLRRCGVTDTVVKFMASGLVESKSVMILDISYNNISSAGAEAIFRSLEHNTSLEELNMSWNRRLAVGDSEAMGHAVERMLTVNTTLKVLKLIGCGLDTTVMKHIATQFPGRVYNASLEKQDMSDMVKDRLDALAQAIKEKERVKISSCISDMVKDRLDALAQAIKEKERVKISIVQGLFMGISRNGKTSLMKRLIGQKPERKTASTGVAEKAVQLDIRKLVHIAASSSEPESRWRIINDLAKESVVLAEEVHLHGFQSNPPSNIGSTQEDSKVREDSQSERKPSIENSLTQNNRHSESGVQLHSQSQQQDSQSQQQDSQSQQQDSQSQQQDSQSQQESQSEQVLKFFKKCYDHTDLSELKVMLEERTFLYLTDCGGQLEFQELLPAMISGPSLFFLVFKLTRDFDLNSHFDNVYEDEVEGISKPVQSSCTLGEYFLQSLASIASTNAFKLKEEGEDWKKEATKPIVIIVGTHKDTFKDEVTGEVDEGMICKIDEKIQDLLKNIPALRQLIYDSCSPNQMIFTIDNFSEDMQDVREIRKAVEDISSRDTFTVSPPVSWLLTGLELRKQDDDVLCLKDCLTKAELYGINTDSAKELDDALFFLHTQTGLIRHYVSPKYKELHEIVIVNPGYLFRQITYLIKRKFSHNKYLDEQFAKAGIFKASYFWNAIRNRNKLLSPEKLLKLLQHLYIVTCLPSAPGVEDRDVEYFMPSVSAKQGETSVPAQQKRTPPLFINFKSGYCPRGLFGSLVVHLIQNEIGSALKWELLQTEVSRYRICLRLTRNTNLLLEENPTAFQIIITVDGSNLPSADRCVEAKRCIENSINVLSQTDAYTNVKYFLAIQCQKCKTESPHFAIEEEDPDGTYFSCSVTKQDAGAIPSDYTSTWFPEMQKNDPHVSSDVRESLHTGGPLRLDKELYPEDLLHVIKAVYKLCGKWQNIHNCLRITRPCDDILRTYPCIPMRCLIKVLDEWLKGAYNMERDSDEPSWRKVAWFVKEETGGNHAALAMYIEKNIAEVSTFMPGFTAKESTPAPLTVDKGPEAFDALVSEVAGWLQDTGAKWFEMGVLLGVSVNNLEIFSQSEEAGNTNLCLQMIVREWLSANVSKPERRTWQVLADVVEHPAGGGYPRLAKRISDYSHQQEQELSSEDEASSSTGEESSISSVSQKKHKRARKHEKKSEDEATISSEEESSAASRKEPEKRKRGKQSKHKPTKPAKKNKKEPSSSDDATESITEGESSTVKRRKKGKEPPVKKTKKECHEDSQNWLTASFLLPLTVIFIAVIGILGYYSGGISQSNDSQRALRQICIDDTPYMKLLWRFPGKDGTIRIIREIGTKYTRLGHELLNDNTGTIVDTIVRQKRENSEEIIVEILRRWLQQSEEPPTWRKLIQVLRDIELRVYADEMENTFDTGPNLCFVP